MSSSGSDATRYAPTSAASGATPFAAQRAVDRAGQRDQQQQPRPVHRRIVPAAERNAAPDLQQRNRRRVVGRGIEIDAAGAREPLLGAHERGDVAQSRTRRGPWSPIAPTRPTDRAVARRYRRRAAGSAAQARRSSRSRPARCQRGSGGRSSESITVRTSTGRDASGTQRERDQRRSGDRERQPDRKPAKGDADDAQQAHPQRQQQRADAVTEPGAKRRRAAGIAARLRPAEREQAAPGRAATAASARR